MGQRSGMSPEAERAGYEVSVAVAATNRSTPAASSTPTVSREGTTITPTTGQRTERTPSQPGDKISTAITASGTFRTMPNATTHTHAPRTRP
jgi:hypothetical protein